MSSSHTNALVADTHIVLWSLFSPSHLSTGAMTALRNAEAVGASVYVSAISLVELRYLIDKGRFVEQNYVDVLNALNDTANSLTLSPLDSNIADAMRRVLRSAVPDMPDRIIAATALHLGVPVVTRDGKIRASGVATIW